MRTDVTANLWTFTERLANVWQRLINRRRNRRERASQILSRLNAFVHSPLESSHVVPSFSKNVVQRLIDQKRSRLINDLLPFGLFEKRNILDLLCCFSSNNSDCKTDRKNQIFTQSCRETLELGAGVQSGAPPDSSAWSRIKKLSLANKAQNGFAASSPCTQLAARLKSETEKGIENELENDPGNESWKRDWKLFHYSEI